MVCMKCGSNNNVKNGKIKQKQRYKCIECGFQFTRETPRGRSKEEKDKAIALYLLGLSMRTIAKLFHVNTTTILYWIRNFAIKTYDKPRPQGAVIVDFDEMWHFIQSKKQKFESSKQLIAADGELWPGCSAIVILKPSGASMIR